MRPELAAEMRKQQAQRKFAESVDSFSNAVYEAADGFKSVAERFKLDVKTATVQRTPAPGATGVLASPRLLETVFSPESIQRKRNTEAVEVAPGRAGLGAHRAAQPVAHQAAGGGAGRGAQARPCHPRGRHGPQGRPGEAGRLEGQSGDGAALRARSWSRARTRRASRSRWWKPPCKPTPARCRPSWAPTSATRATRSSRSTASCRAATCRRPPRRQRQAQYTRMWTGAEALAYYELLKDRFKAQILVPAPAAESAESATR